MNAPARPRLIGPSGMFLILFIIACLAVPVTYIVLNRNAQDAPVMDTSSGSIENAMGENIAAASYVPGGEGLAEIPPGERVIRTLNAYGCMDPFTHDRIQSYARADDQLGFETALTRMTENNRCVRFQTGEKVMAITSALIPGMVQVRRAGDSTLYWMSTGVVR